LQLCVFRQAGDAQEGIPSPASTVAIVESRWLSLALRRLDAVERKPPSYGKKKRSPNLLDGRFSLSLLGF
jgi:hypothetical protein